MSDRRSWNIRNDKPFESPASDRFRAVANVINASREEERREEGRGWGRGMDLSIADIPLAAFGRDDRLGKIDLCRGSSRTRDGWARARNLLVITHTISALFLPFPPVSILFMLFMVRTGTPDRHSFRADQSRSVHRGMLMRSRNEIVSRILFMIICLRHRNESMHLLWIGVQMNYGHCYGDFSTFYFFFLSFFLLLVIS